MKKTMERERVDRWSGAMAGRLFSTMVKSLNFIISSPRNHWKVLSRKVMWSDLALKEHSGCSVMNGSQGCRGCGALEQADQLGNSCSKPGEEC